MCWGVAQTTALGKSCSSVCLYGFYIFSLMEGTQKDYVLDELNP